MGKIVDYEKYRGLDLSILTPRQKQVMEMKLANMRVTDIANKLGTPQPSVSILLSIARAKLDGEITPAQKYYRENVEKFEKYRQKYKDKIAENKRRFHEEHREERLSKMKEYNKEYYSKNRERILAKAKERRKKSMDKSTKSEKT